MPSPEFTSADYRACADEIRSRTAHRPTIGIVLGSGLGTLADAVEDAVSIPTAELPNWPQSHVVGHKNRLVIGKLQGKTVLVQQGRSHFYEGWTMAQATFPIRVMQAMGISLLIVTNAAGGINKAYAAGDLMLISDHINLLGMTGSSPLHGPNDESLGPRFPDMARAYDPELRKLVKQIAAEKNIELREGIYCGLSGPTFETPAEVRMIRMLGADAVGMSTVGEVVVARHAGIKVIGFSGISNACIDNDEPVAEVTHEEVLAIGVNKIVPNLVALVKGVLTAL